MAGRRSICLCLLLCIVFRAQCATISPPVYDAIIVGLGSSGATAANELAKAGKKVLALEAQNRTGGRIYTFTFDNGIMELGAEWIHGTVNSRSYDIGLENNIDMKSREYKMNVFRSNGEMGDGDLVAELVEYGFNVTGEATESEPVGVFTTRKIKSYLKENYPDVLKDKDFVEEFLNMLNLFVDSNEASNDWNDVNALSRYKELGGDPNMSWHKNGYKTFIELLLNQYKNGTGHPTLDIKLNTEVTNIKWPASSEGDVVVSTARGEQYTAKHVIVTMSVGVLKERHATLFTPNLPQEKITAIKTIPLGVVNKIQLIFEKPWWGKGGVYAFLWKGEERKAVADEDKWTTKILGANSADASDTVMTLWTSGDTAKLIETLPEVELKNKSMKLIRRFLGKKYDIPEPIGIVRSSWYSNPYTRGSYTYENDAVIANPSVRVSLREPLKDAAGIPRVLFAGEATDESYFSTVHGASDAGYREARRLLDLKA